MLNSYSLKIIWEVIFAAVTKKVLSETEQQLTFLEDLAKDAHLHFELKENDKKFALLQEQKFAELEKLKSI